MRRARDSAAACVFLLLTAGAASPQPRPSPAPVDKAWAEALGLVLDYDEAPKLVKTAPFPRKTSTGRELEGTVVFEVAIDAKGHVIEARVVQAEAGLEEAALAWAKSWKFKPAKKDGRPVATALVEPWRFSSRQSPPEVLSMPSEEEGGRSLHLTGFDSKGANFMQWFAAFKAEVYGHWVVPEQALSGFSGDVTLEFVVERDGRVSKIQTYRAVVNDIAPPGARQFDDSAYAALKASHLPALPADYDPPRITLRVTFSFVKPRPAKS